MKLSFEKDRLVATQGVIDRLLLKDARYSAGVFSSISVKQLLWTKAPKASDIYIHKTPIYPSWSWAGMSGIELCFEYDMVIESTEMAKLADVKKFDIFNRKGEIQPECWLTIEGVLRE